MTDIVPVLAFEDNYLWVLRNGNSAVVVDPGDAKPLLDYLAREHLRLTAILNTHHHDDHVGGNAELLRHYKVPVYGPIDARIPEVTVPLHEGMRVHPEGLDIEFSVLDIPGHTRSHIAFYSASSSDKAGVLFCGDTLFACGCGRLFDNETPAQMHASLNKLAALPGDTRVYCAHEYTLANLKFARTVDPASPVLKAWEDEAKKLRAENKPTVPSTIAHENAGNPFLRCDDAVIIAAAKQHSGTTLANADEVFGALRAWKNNFK